MTEILSDFLDFKYWEPLSFYIWEHLGEFTGVKYKAEIKAETFHKSGIWVLFSMVCGDIYLSSSPKYFFFYQPYCIYAVNSSSNKQ